MVPSRSFSPWDSRWALISSKRPDPSFCCSRRCRKFRMVVSSGRGPESFSPHEPPHRVRLVEQVFHAGVAEVVEELDAVGSEHDRQRVGVAAPASLGIEGTDPLLQALPGNQSLHTLQENFPAGLALLALVFQIGKSRLVHHPFTPFVSDLPVV